MRWSWLHARWHVNRQDRKAKGVPNGRASIYVGRDDLGRGSYNRRGETVGQGSAGRPHELAISSWKQYALMATCWPLLVVQAHLPLPRPSLARILAFQPFPTIELHLQTWMSRTKSYLYESLRNGPEVLLR